MKLIYKNADGVSIELLTETFRIKAIKGFETPKNKIFTSKSPSQDGETATGETLDMAERIITGDICVENVGIIEKYRRQLITVFKPHSDGVLEFIDDNVDKICYCKVEDLTFGTASDVLQPFDITLLCPNPFWQDICESINEIALWLSGFEFAAPDGFEFPGDGMEFGERAPSLIVNVNNPGDVDCGMCVIFTALATLTNPSVFNVDTREQFKILKTMQPGEIIEVNTRFGEKSVTGRLNGQTLNYINYADLLNSTFMQLRPGDNPMRYNADTGLDSLNVMLRYSPQYLGV